MSKHARRRSLIGFVVIFFLLCGGASAWLAFEQPVEHYSAPVHAIAQVVASSVPLSPLEEAPQPTCSRGGVFTPTWISIQGVTTHLPVFAVPRTVAGISGTLPVTTASKWQVGWDEASRQPGSAEGNTLLTAHTWPSFDPALGNELLAKLGNGATMTLHGANGQRACYQVVQIVSRPVAEYPSGEVYRMDGTPGLAITVCSGTRLGPGNWSERTVWFAKAVK